MRSELQILQECQGIDAPVALLLAFHRRAVLAYREKGRCVPMQSQSTRETLSISIRATERSSRHNGPLEKEERRVRCYDVWNDDRAILDEPFPTILDFRFGCKRASNQITPPVQHRERQVRAPSGKFTHLTQVCAPDA